MASRQFTCGILAALGLFIGGCGTADRDLATISGATDLVLYEGMPHPYHEPKLLAEEKASKPTRELAGHPFYREPLELASEDASFLREILADRGSIATYVGDKKCGGFHPDYAVAWTGGGAPTQALICLGCHEVLISGRNGQARYDLRQHAYDRLKSLLGRYVTNRPPMRPEY
jgi:hypothetical protein